MVKKGRPTPLAKQAEQEQLDWETLIGKGKAKVINLQNKIEQIQKRSSNISQARGGTPLHF